MPDVDRTKLLETLQGLTSIVENRIREPYGPAATPDVQKAAGAACVALCGGNTDQARTLWRLITADLGYFPHCVAIALQRASSTNLVPDVTPVETNW